MGLNFVRKKSYSWGEARLLAGLSGLMEHQGKYAEAFELLFKSLKIAEENNLLFDIARANRRIGGIYAELQNYQMAITYYLKALQIDEANQYHDKVAIDHWALGNSYEKINKLDSAAYHINFALKQKDLIKGLIQYVYAIDGHIKLKQGNYEQAAISYKKGFEKAQMISDLVSSSELCVDFSNLYIQRNLRDSAIFYALKGFNYGKEISFEKGIMLNGYLLAELYDSIAPLIAFKYFKIAAAAEHRLFGVKNIHTIQVLLAREETKQKELEDAKIAYHNKLRLFGLLTGLAVLLIIAFILYRNNRHKQKVNKQLEQQKEALQKTLSELKSTQAQLIQSEKMASLGQLIAGIAHEINTPLGAINASVNTITDSSQQSIKLLPVLVKILSDVELKLFMELVNRSATSNNSLSSKEEREVRRKITTQLEESGITEANDFADILVDMGIYDEIENYLPLYKTQTMQTAYHLSMQIKNSQNIKMAVDRASKVVFALKNYARYGNEQSMVEASIVDGLETVLTLYQNQMKHGITLHKSFEEVPQILCYPDELNQVWTNLIHNAIQAMEGKGELSISVTKNLTVSSDLSVFENQDIKNPKGFQNLWGLRVRITDTGKGIPPEIKDRIFDAFFTTKPAGEGSGLGLHIVKQIIDKHKGSITFESGVEKGTSFKVSFPIEDVISI